jgi:peptidoglycan-associated lipoprotein
MRFLSDVLIRRVGPALILCALLGGCATPHSNVILMPDDDGHVGAVVVSGGGASHRVERAWDQVVASRGRAATPPAARGQQAVEAAYADLIGAQPSRPRTFTINFLLDSTTMTEVSKATLPEIVATVRSRAPTEVTVYGHADAIGSEAHNDRLSAERARLVADILRKADPTLDRLEVHACGDRMPLVSSAAHGPEPRNRRVEVVIL